MGAVYALIDPEIMLPFYVGLSKTPSRRMEDHIINVPGSDFWKKGISHIFQVMEYYDDSSLGMAEKLWVKRFIDRGITIENRRGMPSLESLTHFVYDCDNFVYVLGGEIHTLKAETELARLERVADHEAEFRSTERANQKSNNRKRFLLRQ